MDIYLVVTLVVLLVELLLGHLGVSSLKKSVELKDVLNVKYYPKLFNGTWVSDDSITYIHNSSVWMYNVTSQTSWVKLSNITIEKGFHLVSFSKDWKYVLFMGKQKKVYRHSFEAQYKVLNVETETITSLDSDDSYLQSVNWLPQGHNLVYVKDNNLFYVNESFKYTDALTTDGKKGVLYNGIADWVYEEEVFSRSWTTWFSPDGKMLAYIKYNDSLVHDMNYMYYGEAQYPELVTFKYPKAGTPNPIVELHLITFDGITFDIVPEKFTFSGEAILTDVVWTWDNQLVVTWQNRVQNHSNTFRCELKMMDSMADCKLILDYSEENGWVDLPSPVMSRKDTSFLTILPRIQQDWRSYPQLVLVTSEGEETLTQGLLTVTKILGWDQTRNVVFYKAVRASHSSELHVYMIQIDTGTVLCLSCSLDNPCTYSSAVFSEDFTYYTLTCNGPGVPYVEVRYTKGLGKKALVSWEDNQLLRRELEYVDLPTHEDIYVPLDGGFEALVRMQLPKQMDRSGRLKYPLILNVYGGPGYSIVSDGFTVDFHTYLVSKRHVIVVQLNTRGSAYRSKEQEHSVYRNLGRYEIEDHIAAIKYLTQRFQFIDRDRIGVWGWSYGGYTAGMVLGTDKENLFHCGISVAPVTNFLYYDSIYTERYMGLPDVSDNQAGYNRTNMASYVDNFRNKSFLLIHGTADDNVHYQQSMALAQALEEKDIFFYQQSYPDQAHAIPSYQKHVYHSMNHFWTECLNLYPGTI